MHILHYQFKSDLGKGIVEVEFSTLLDRTLPPQMKKKIHQILIESKQPQRAVLLKQY